MTSDDSEIVFPIEYLHIKHSLKAVERIVDAVDAKGARIDPTAMPVLMGSVGCYYTLPLSIQNKGLLPAGAIEGLTANLEPGQVIMADGIIDWFKKHIPGPIRIEAVRRPGRGGRELGGFYIGALDKDDDFVGFGGSGTGGVF
jgi:hypothetical protein